MRDADEPRDCEAAEVVCVWCGGAIHRGAVKAARRRCRPCFAHGARAQPRTPAGRGAALRQQPLTATRGCKLGGGDR